MWYRHFCHQPQSWSTERERAGGDTGGPFSPNLRPGPPRGPKSRIGFLSAGNPALDAWGLKKNRVCRRPARHTSLAFELPSRLAVASSEMEPSRRVVGKRQVRPNMARQDFGYVERSRAAANKGMKGVKPKREDEEDGSAPMRSEKDARSLVRAPSPPIAGRATRHRPCSVLTPTRPAAARRSTSQNWTWLR